MSNFTFLEHKWDDLAKLGDLAEKYIYSDPNSSIMKQGMCAEQIVKYMLAYEGIPEPEEDNTQVMRIRLLKDEGLLPYEIKNTLHILRKDRNEATHEAMDEQAIALGNLELLYKLCVWFMQVYGDGGYDYEPEAYIAPVDMTVNLADLERENQELEARNQELLIELNRIRESGGADTARRAAAYQRAHSIDLSEAQTRELIDEQLRRVGWEADTENIRYSKGTRPKKGHNYAIAEFPTDSALGNHGYADYALFIGEQLVGIVEAKRKHKDIPSVLDYQCKDYAKNIKAEHQKYVIKRFGQYMVPFLFATNGREYFKQYEEKSGLWCLDVRSQFNTGKALPGWFSPEGIELALEKDIEEAKRHLLSTSYEVLQDPEGLNLRDYQVDAIKAAEKAIVQDKKTEVLLAMATGTGKTRTVLGMIYRFLAAKLFKRVLYLVDRTALGEQTADTFRAVKLEDLKTLNELYDMKELGEKDIEKDTRLVIATVQSLVKRVMYNETGEMPGSSDFDLIIVDEAHRGYILDKEMTEDEVLYRNQEDFRSKYKTAIEYFDAVKVALTATPALHTTEIFGEPVYTYDYRTAVVDGFLVDHDAPHRITTKLTDEGIHLKAGSVQPIYDPVTDTIINGAELPDDLDFDVDDFNKRIVNKPTTEAILEDLVKYIDPNEPGKTLIFAVDDAHADMVVSILKQLYAAQGISEEAIKKITGSIENGNSKKIRAAIKRFKNETWPNIVVTVDLLSTGVDVEKIVNIVFLRRIKSRILFEQMLGRATRLCPEIGKTHFEIYDAVKLYEALSPMSSMKPVVTNPSVSFQTLIDGIDVLETEQARRNQVDMIVAKIMRNKGRMSDANREQFKSLAGGKSPEEFVEYLRKAPTEKAVESVKAAREAFAYVKGTPISRTQVISDVEDKVISHERGYGNATRPEDYLKEFRDFIDNNRNQILALNIIATRPKDLTRESLKELKLILDRNNFSETKLQTAWREMTNEDIAADIISFIRQRSIGDALISKDERIHTAIEKLKAAHPEFTKVQINWLMRIEEYLKKETVLNRETFDSVAFKNKGGYDAVNKAFGNKLDEVIGEINAFMYPA
ncbi:MAG: type I restriction-modification system endonuclease [Lachnospiraceae bacterium]|nr:type I restriction-modification system endonuclease [Lachnospiraceae bacterium]